MGWFDESDDDDDEKESKKMQPLISDFGDVRPALGQDDDDDNHNKYGDNHDQEEDDPLDSYMKSLDSTTRASSAAAAVSSTNNTCNHRLDWENEEEATSHWTEHRTESPPQHNTDQHNPSEESDSLLSERAENAKKALNTYFVKSEQGKRKQEESMWDPKIEAASVFDKSDSFEKVFWNLQKSTKAGHDWRRSQDVHLAGKKMANLAADPIFDFAELRDVFGPALLNAIAKAGFVKPTTVQSQTLPLALAGRDVLVTAMTGQGKTMSYVWPVTVHIAAQPPLRMDETGPMAIVLAPTRELAIQVHKQAKPMIQAVGLSSKAVIGGQGKYLLQQELKKSNGVELVVATPGRLLDVLSDKKGMSLRRTTLIVLDEADKMLQMGFETQVRKILQSIRKDRQTLMFSATMGTKIERVARDWLQPDYVRISVGRTGESSENVEQHVIVLPDYGAKLAFTKEMIPTLVNIGRTLIFVSTRESCETLASKICETVKGISVATLHGDKHQSDRNAALRAFSRGEVMVLIGTDVAARGLDVPSVRTVLNFDPAKNLDAHVHRVGRAGRLSKENSEQQIGSAYTLLTQKDADFAMVLRNAFEREGRPIAAELDSLAHKSRKSGGSGNPAHSSKAGLGFYNPEREERRKVVIPTDGDTVTREAKRSRWS